jgi:hypothetical protein
VATFDTKAGGNGGNGGGPGGSGGSGGSSENVTNGNDGSNGSFNTLNIDSANYTADNYFGGGDGYAEVSFTELTPPDYSPTIVQAVPDPVKVGEQLTVDYEVGNNGEADEEYDVELWVGGEKKATNTHNDSIVGGEHTYTPTSSDVGSNVTVELRTVHDAGTDSTSQDITIQSLPNFQVTVESINDTVDQGDDVVIDYVVENTGDTSGTKDIRLLRNGANEQTTQDVTIASGNTYQGTFTYTTVFDDVQNELTLTVETDDDSITYDINVLSTTFAEGHVYLDGNPVQGAQVRLINSDTDTYIGVETTDNNGFYSFDPAPDSEYHMVVEYDDGSGNLYHAANNPFIGSDADSGAFVPPLRNNVDFELQPYTAPTLDSVDFSLINLINADSYASVSGTATSPSISGMTLSHDEYVEASTETLSPSIAGMTLSHDEYPEATATALSPNLYTEYWVLDGIDLRTVQSYTETYDGFEFTIHGEKSYVRDKIRQFEEYAGKASKEPTASGGFYHLDQAGGNNTYTLQPPAERRDAYADDIPVLITSYSETPLSQGTYEVTIEMVRQEPRDYPSAFDYGSDSRSGTQWLFSFDPDNQFTHPGVTWDISTEGDTKSLTLPGVTERGKNILTDFAAAQEGVSTDVIPNGENLHTDNTPTKRNTVEITPGDDISDSDFIQGTYIVLGWTVTPAGSNRYTIEMQVTSQ